MSEPIQIALQTLLKTLPELADQPDPVGEVCTRSDPKALDSGAEHIAVIWPGTFNSSDAAGGTLTRIWNIPFDLFKRFGDTDAEIYQAFTAFRDDVIELLDSYPTLNGQPNITLDRLSTSGDVAEVMDSQGGGPYFLTQPFLLEITERVDLTGGEYA